MGPGGCPVGRPLVVEGLGKPPGRLLELGSPLGAEEGLGRPPGGLLGLGNPLGAEEGLGRPLAGELGG